MYNRRKCNDAYSFIFHIFFYICIFYTGILVSCASGGITTSKSFFTASEKNIFAEYYAIAEEYSKLSKHQKAVEYYLKAADYPGYEKQIRYKIARSYALASDWDNSLISFLKLLEQDPDNVSLMMSAAYVYAKKDQTEQAAALYEKIIDKRVYDASVVKNLILLYAAAGREVDVSRYITVYAEKFPEDDSINTVKTESASLLEKYKKNNSITPSINVSNSETNISDKPKS